MPTSPTFLSYSLSLSLLPSLPASSIIKIKSIKSLLLTSSLSHNILVLVLNKQLEKQTNKNCQISVCLLVCPPSHCVCVTFVVDTSFIVQASPFHNDVLKQNPT